MVKYVSNILEMRMVIESRKDNALIINQRLDEYWQKRGISWKEVREMFGSVCQDETELVLWRNIPETPNLERLIAEVFKDLLVQETDLNLKLRLLSFKKDHFDKRNPSKLALVSVASSNGNKNTVDCEEIEGKPIYQIMIGKSSLLDFHREMAKEIFISPFADNDIDIVRIFSLALVGALERGSNKELKSIGSVYIENRETGFIEQFRLSEGKYFKNESSGKILTVEELIYLCQDGLVRPSAKWYYMLFLSLFISGDRVLLETFDDTPEFIPIVESAAKIMKNEIGYEPLIIKMPISVPNISTGENIPTENYPLWVLNGHPDKRKFLYRGLAYENAKINLYRHLPLEVTPVLIGMDIILPCLWES